MPVQNQNEKEPLMARLISKPKSTVRARGSKAVKPAKKTAKK